VKWLPLGPAVPELPARTRSLSHRRNQPISHHRLTHF
jgi:hypothetical protein